MTVKFGMLALDASFSGDPSCTTGASRDKTYTIKAPSQQSQTSLNKDSNTTADPPESESSTDELALDYKLPAKRLRRHSKLSHQP